MIIKPQEAVFLFDDGKVFICKKGDHSTCRKWRRSLGACHTHWEKLTDDEAFQAMTWIALEIVEFSGVPIRLVRDQMEDRVIGYKRYADASGRLALGRGPIH